MNEEQSFLEAWDTQAALCLMERDPSSSSFVNKLYRLIVEASARQEENARIFREASAFPVPVIRSGVARYCTHKPILYKLCVDNNPFVRNAVASNPHTTEDMLEILSTDTDYQTRELVANHANTSKQTMERMLKDDNPHVRARCTFRLK